MGGGVSAAQSYHGRAMMIVIRAPGDPPGVALNLVQSGSSPSKSWLIKPGLD